MAKERCHTFVFNKNAVLNLLKISDFALLLKFLSLNVIF